MTQILNNTVFSKKATANAEDEKYNYQVSYELADSDKAIVSISVHVVTKANNAFAGDMTYQNLNKPINIPESVDQGAVLAMFDSIIAEIKSNLTAE